jgi:hypothetical protein
VVGQRANIAMADDRRAACEQDRVTRGASARVRQVHDHAAVVDLADADAAEFGETGVLGLERAAAERALFIVHELHDPLTELSHDQDHARVAIKLGSNPLTAEDDAETALALRAAYVLRTLHVNETRLEVEIAEVAVHRVQHGAEIVRPHGDAGHTNGHIHGRQTRRQRAVEPGLPA